MNEKEMFWHSAMLYYLGKIFKVADEYNNQMGSIYTQKFCEYVRDMKYFDTLLFDIYDYPELIQSICPAIELILDFISVKMPAYVEHYVSCCNR